MPELTSQQKYEQAKALREEYRRYAPFFGFDRKGFIRRVRKLATQVETWHTNEENKFECWATMCLDHIALWMDLDLKYKEKPS